jgi:hypothetical protein
LLRPAESAPAVRCRGFDLPGHFSPGLPPSDDSS